MRRLREFMPGLALLLPLCVPSHATRADNEIEIPLSEVPEQVLTAVRNARSDIELRSAARSMDESGTLYEIEGDVGDEELEFVVNPDGRIVETEKE